MHRRFVNLPRDASWAIPVFNTVAGDGKYNARYDLNADSKVGLQDMLIYTPFFNLTCTP